MILGTSREIRVSIYKLVNNNRRRIEGNNICNSQTRALAKRYSFLTGRWMPLPPLASIVQNCQMIRSPLRVCHIPGLVCQDRPPMNIFLEKKDDSIRLAIRSRVIGGRGSGCGETASRG